MKVGTVVTNLVLALTHVDLEDGPLNVFVTRKCITWKKLRPA